MVKHCPDDQDRFEGQLLPPTPPPATATGDCDCDSDFDGRGAEGPGHSPRASQEGVGLDARSAADDLKRPRARPPT